MSLTDSTTEQGLSSAEAKELLDIELFLTNGIHAYQEMLILWFTLMLGQFINLLRSYGKVIQTGNRYSSEYITIIHEFDSEPVYVRWYCHVVGCLAVP